MKEEALKILIGLIKKFEGCRLESYPDPGSGGRPYTIGYGHTAWVEQNDTCTQDQADEWLKEEAKGCIEKALRLSPRLNTPGRIAAIADFIYNCGASNYKHSTLKMEIDDQHWEGAKMQILRWNRASGRVMRGLIRRRQAEADLI